MRAHHDFDPYEITPVKEPGHYRYKVFRDGVRLQSYPTLKKCVRFIADKRRKAERAALKAGFPGGRKAAGPPEA